MQKSNTPRLTHQIKFLLLGLTICFCHFSSLGQQSKIDSLLTILQKDKEDTNKVNHLNELSEKFWRTGVNENAIQHANSALALAEKLNFKKGKAKAYSNIGSAYSAQGDYTQALKNRFAALNIYNEIGFKKGVAISYNNIGNIYIEVGNYPEALKNYFSSLKIKEEIGDSKGVAASYVNIAEVYRNQNNFHEALKSYYSSLKICQAINNKDYLSYNYTGIGNVYYRQADILHKANGNMDTIQNKLNEALKNYIAALIIRKDIGEKNNIATSYNNIGNVYYTYVEVLRKIKGNPDSIKNKFTEAIKNHFAALKIREEIGDKYGVANSYGNIGAIYFGEGNFKDAQEYLQKSLSICKLIGAKELLKTTYETLSSLCDTLKNQKEALEYYKMHILYRDSLINEANTKKTLQAQMNYEFDKKEAETKAEHVKEMAVAEAEKKTAIAEADKKRAIAEADKKTAVVEADKKMAVTEADKKIAVAEAEKKRAMAEADKKTAVVEADKRIAVSEAEKRKQKIVIWSVISGLFLVVVFAGFIFRSLRVTRKQKQIIEIKSKETEQQKHIIEEKNKDITDSINYARRIQRAMLPHRKDIWTALPQSFVLFKPKDIVSGDFYFFYKDNQSIFIASADCTGHGVPGAFMSMIGSAKLNDAVSESSDTSEILSLLNKGVKIALKQSEEDEKATRDGMDIALCSVDTNARVVKYAGANRPIWIIRNGQTAVEEIKATKKAIGGFTEDSQHFDSHEIKFEKGDTFYISTDGFADTFGGQEQKKVTTKRFKEILLSIQDKTMKEQELHLDSFIQDWKGGTEQIDDILVIGVRL